jgi:lipopolysaccharide export LptBFGC system permease protein LptF
MDILCRNSDHVDIKKYFVKSARWNPTRCIWELTNVKVTNYGPTSAVSSEETHDELDFDSTTPPSQMVLVNTTPDQLSFHELGEYIETVQTAAKMAQYRTEWWYRIFYPSSLVVLLLFSLSFGTQTGRKSALTPVVWCIVVFLAYFALVQLFRATGQSNRINPVVAASAVEGAFALLGVVLLAQRIGWFREIRGFFIRNGLLRAPAIESS